jgi:hypothetical protein
MIQALQSLSDLATARSPSIVGYNDLNICHHLNATPRKCLGYKTRRSLSPESHCQIRRPDRQATLKRGSPRIRKKWSLEQIVLFTGLAIRNQKGRTVEQRAIDAPHHRIWRARQEYYSNDDAL